MNKLNVEQITDIPKLRNLGHTDQEIAEMFSVSRITINYWVRRLRDEGYEIKRFSRGGKKPMIIPKPKK
jgi:transposase